MDLPRWTLTPELLHRLLQHRPAVAIELHLHQVCHEVHDGDLEAAARQAARRFEAEQAAADHRGRLRVGGAGEHALAVLEGAEDEDAVLAGRAVAGSVEAFSNGGTNGTRAGGDDQRVVGLGPAVGAVDHASPRGRCAAAPTPACSVTSFSVYQSSGLMKMSSGSCVPASTPESRMRL